MTVETTFLKTNEELLKIKDGAKGAVFALSEEGNQYSSKQFSNLVFTKLEDGGSHLTILIGGVDGLSQDIRKTIPLISLSKMTFTHQHARLLLVEQLYRASEIRKGSKYHKE